MKDYLLLVFNKNLLTDDNAFIYKLNNDGTTDPTVLISYAGSSSSITIPNQVQVINPYTFSEAGITSVTFGSNLKTIENNAFYNNRISSITFPNSLESIKN